MTRWSAAFVVFLALAVRATPSAQSPFPHLRVVGAGGCLMRVGGVPLVPAVMGLILGPLAEQQFRRAVAISEGDQAVFLTRPLSAVLLVIAALVLPAPWLVRRGRT